MRTSFIRAITTCVFAVLLCSSGIAAAAQATYSFTGSGLIPPSSFIPFSSTSFFGATVSGSISFETGSVVPVSGGEGIKSIVENSPINLSLSNGNSVSALRNWTHVGNTLASQGASVFGDFFYNPLPVVFSNDSDVGFLGLTFFLPSTVPANLMAIGASLEGVEFGAFMKLQDMSNGQSFDFAFSGTFATPVPEPEVYAMLLAGLGLLNFIGRRRKQSVT